MASLFMSRKVMLTRSERKGDASMPMLDPVQEPPRRHTLVLPLVGLLVLVLLTSRLSRAEETSEQARVRIQTQAKEFLTELGVKLVKGVVCAPGAFIPMHAPWKEVRVCNALTAQQQI